MPIIATCMSIGALLAAAKGGEEIRLNGRCPTVTIDRHYPRPVSILADGALVRGLVISGGNVKWQGGTIEAPGGAYGKGPTGYGVNLKRGASSVWFDDVLFTNAHRGIAADGIDGLTVTNSRFLQLGSDGIIAHESRRLVISKNRFADTRARPTQCAIGADVQLAVSRRDCVAAGGSWKDGDHADAIQLRNAVKDVRISGNRVEGATQGMSQMDRKTDLPLERVIIEDNVIITDAPHKATLTNCIDCIIRGNEVRKPKGSKWKALIIPGPAARCGNIEDDAKQREARC